jgi:hypothetical protein
MHAKIGDLVVHNGFCENPRIHHGAWGVVSDSDQDRAKVIFTNVHWPRPDEGGMRMLRIASELMYGTEAEVSFDNLFETGRVPSSEEGTSFVWEWMNRSIPAQKKHEILVIWSAALKSAQYKQIRECLRTNKGFSAMGLACDVIGKKYGIKWRWKDNFAGMMSSFTQVPTQLLDLLNMSREEADFVEKLNDNGHTFQEIASWVDTRLVALSSYQSFKEAA